MSLLTLNQELMSGIPAPVSGKATINLDTDGRIKAIFPDGHIEILSPSGLRDRNYLVNPEFQFAQRQVPGTLTTYSSTTARVYSADRWAHVNSVASLQFQNVDTQGSPQANLKARFYGVLKQITNPGKFVLIQTLEGTDSDILAGRTVRFQFKARYGVNPMTIHFGLLYLTSAGTIDVLPTTIASAFGVAGTNPTWGTNLSLIAPTSCEATGTLNAATSECSAVLSAAFQRFSATFVLPAGTAMKNLIVAIWSDALPVANDTFHISEAGLFDGSEIRDYYPRHIADELALCQRYYEKSFLLATAPAQSVAAGCVKAPVGIAGATALAFVTAVKFLVRMRVAASAAVTGITLYNPGAANAMPRDIVTPVDMSSPVTTDNTDTGFNLTATGGAGGIIGDVGAFHWTCDVDI
jgi:hypothetical protein